MMKKIFAASAVILLLVSARIVKAQGNITKDDLRELKALEADLIRATDSMYSAPIPDMRADYCAQFVKLLVRTLKIPNSYEYPFDSLATKINIIYPDDKSFRIFNWNIAPTNITRRYYGAIQVPGEQLKLYPLVDYTYELGKGAADSVLTDGKWLGCLYYNIITHEVNGQKIYTLFGLNASNSVSNRKVLDPMVISPAGPVFGAPIFSVPRDVNPNGRINRFILEYKKDAQAAMNFDKDMDAIYFDRLISEVNDPNRKYTYVPSGQYDGLRWQNERWVFVPDIISIEIRKDGDVPNIQPAGKNK